MAGPGPWRAVTGTLRPGSVLASVSTGHTLTGSVIGGFGVLLLGGSRTAHQGQALPLNLDPLLGTQGCSLQVSIDATRLGLSLATRPASLQFLVPVPATLQDITVHLQHAGFDRVPGGTSWSNGVTVRIAN